MQLIKRGGTIALFGGGLGSARKEYVRDSLSESAHRKFCSDALNSGKSTLRMIQLVFEEAKDGESLAPVCRALTRSSMLKILCLAAYLATHPLFFEPAWHREALCHVALPETRCAQFETSLERAFCCRSRGSPHS